MCTLFYQDSRYNPSPPPVPAPDVLTALLLDDTTYVGPTPDVAESRLSDDVNVTPFPPATEVYAPVAV